MALLLAECTIRRLRPELRNVVDTQFQRNAYRIHENPRSRAYTFVRWRGGKEIAVVHNALGFRQHREFERAKPPDTLRIGIFGDSFAENLRIEAPYSFSEPLDFLLNEAGVKAEVLNFGTDGYGTDQVYLQYRDESPDLGLDIVVYLFCHNDLVDILADRLFELSPDRELRYLPRPSPAFWVGVARRFYLTYAVLGAVATQRWDVQVALRGLDPDSVIHVGQEKRNRGRLVAVESWQPSGDLDRSLALFGALAATLRDETKARGQKLVVVLLPRFAEPNRRIAKVLAYLGIPAVDLFPAFEAEPQPRARSFFERDPHWNEEGNKLAAVHLFRYLARELDVDVDESFVPRTLADYYRAFDAEKVSPLHLAGAEAPPLSETRKREIRARYLALEPDPDAGSLSQAVRPSSPPSPSGGDTR